MNNFINEHREKLSVYVIVFGLSGLAVFAAELVGLLVVRYGAIVMSMMRGIL